MGKIMHERIKRAFVLAVIALTVGACTANNIFAQKPIRMGKRQDGLPAYNQGWDDGCETGLATMSFTSYKSFYRFKQDPTMTKNNTYYKAWKDAYTYCRQYSFRWMWDPWDRMETIERRWGTPEKGISGMLKPYGYGIASQESRGLSGIFD